MRKHVCSEMSNTLWATAGIWTQVYLYLKFILPVTMQLFKCVNLSSQQLTGAEVRVRVCPGAHSVKGQLRGAKSDLGCVYLPPEPRAAARTPSAASRLPTHLDVFLLRPTAIFLGILDCVFYLRLGWMIPLLMGHTCLWTLDSALDTELFKD